MTHADLAAQRFQQGYNCSQAVALAFSDVTGLDDATLAKLAVSFGGGMGRMREVCGAVSGMLMVAGYLFGSDDPCDRSAKACQYALVQEMARRFRERNGSILCRELLGVEGKDHAPTPTERNATFYKKRPCVQMVRDAADILDEIIKEKSGS